MGMQWLLGFDVMPNSVGALRLGRWLHDRTRGDHEIHGMHVVARSTSGLHNRVGAGPDLDAEQRHAHRFVERYEVADVLRSIEVRPGEPERVLRHVMDEGSYDALLLGRAAPAGKLSLVSLGRVPRRLLRRLAWPVVVAPPELQPRRLGRGPVVIGVAPSDHCLAAVRWGQQLAQALGLSVLLAHGIPRAHPVASFGALAYEPRDPVMATGDIAEPQDTSHDDARLESWLEAHELDALPLEVRRGPVAATLRDIGREVEATLLVCGSRRLSLAERIVSSSVGTDLAAHAALPVALVPPTE